MIGILRMACAAVILTFGAGGLRSAPLWRRLLSRPMSAKAHLRLAEGHAKAGRCGAAVFHYRKAMPGVTQGMRKRLRERIRGCLRRSGWGPPPPRRDGAPLWVAVSPESRVTVPGGWVRVGSDGPERVAAVALCRYRLGKKGASRCSRLPLARERSPRWVRVRGFRVDRTEVSWARYERCVRAGRCARLQRAPSAPAARRLPVVGVTLGEAARFCRFVGGRLPTESEWTAAGRGTGLPVAIWPWGRYASPGCAVGRSGGKGGRRQARRTGRRPLGQNRCDASRLGVLGLAGSVREWTLPGGGAARAHGIAGARGVARGGSRLTPEWMSRIAARQELPAQVRVPDLGFRCVYSVKLPPRSRGRNSPRRQR